MTTIPGYRIIRELGRGGMATVHLAEQESLGREVALKVLNPALAADADFAERFLREARIAGSFRHRSLLPVFDAGRAGDQLYLAMEYLPAGHAGDLRGGDPDEIRRCVVDVAAGLAYAHGKGVVHRDIKPENILRREDGSYVLADFGIARSAQATRELTGPQSAIGTPSYMSPEQWRGEAIDGRADLYSLGIVAHELLTGRTPFQGGDGWAIGLQHMNAARPQLPDALGDWQAILDRLLAVDRDTRYTTAGELIAALGGKPEPTPPAATPRPQQALHSTTPIPLPMAAMRKRKIAAATVAAIAVVLAIAAVGYRTTQAPRAPADSTPAAAAAGSAQTVAATGKSVAVLPFRVLSTDPADAMFADGLSEEILASLAAIPELKVPGRTSSFAWKDKPAGTREIADALGVAHLLEGSIRRSGTQLRITANLIGAVDGTTLWTQTFDRSTDDVFAIQNEIAIAVSDRLAVQIGTRSLPTLARLPAALRGRYLETVGALRAMATADMPAQMQTLREIEASEQGGPDLYVRLLHTAAHLARNGSLDYATTLPEQAGYLRKLNSRFPGSIESLQGQAIAVQTRGDASNRVADYEEALGLFQQVLARAPNDALAATQSAFAARTLLRHEQAISLARRAIAIDPEDPGALFALVVALGSAGQGDAAIAAMRDVVQRFPDSGYAENLSVFLVGNGQLADAIMANRDCMQRPRTPCGIAVRILHLLGYDRSADAMLAQRPESLRTVVDGYHALRSGQLPDPSYASGSFLSLIEAVSEATAQQSPERVTEYLRVGPAALHRYEQHSPMSPDEFDMRAAILFVGDALGAEGKADPERSQRDLEAVVRIVRAMPPKSMPYPTVHWALGAEILSGNLDAAFRRLDGMADLNPLHWQYWVISPSGRDMPTARILRADPRFAAIWQRREALIARERAKLKQLWPEVE